MVGALGYRILFHTQVWNRSVIFIYLFIYIVGLFGTWYGINYPIPDPPVDPTRAERSFPSGFFPSSACTVLRWFLFPSRFQPRNRSWGQFLISRESTCRHRRSGEAGLPSRRPGEALRRRLPCRPGGLQPPFGHVPPSAPQFAPNRPRAGYLLVRRGSPLADPAGPCAAGSCATPARPCSTSSRAAIARPCAAEDPLPHLGNGTGNHRHAPLS